MMLFRRGFFFPISAISFLAAAQAFGSNLFQNSGFDSSLAGWATPGYSTASWNGFGHGGGTGSALVSSLIGRPGDAPNAPIEQCVAVQAGHSYAFGASLYVPGSTAPGAQISEYLDVRFYPGPSCSGAELLQNVSQVNPPLRDVWAGVQSNATAPTGAVSAKAALGAVDFAGSAATESIQIYVDDAYFFSDQSCADSDSHLCLSAGRFRLSGSWSVPEQSRSGYMRAVPITQESGLFWFFSPDNLEIFVKVHNACVDPFNRYWVFVSGLTNVGVAMDVEDTANGSRQSYTNSPGTAFPPVLDTSAFATCP
ncbi:MAG: hypothetical protein ACM3SU_05775 [Acidobacteriota bacterium]